MAKDVIAETLTLYQRIQLSKEDYLELGKIKKEAVRLGFYDGCCYNSFSKQVEQRDVFYVGQVVVSKKNQESYKIINKNLDGSVSCVKVGTNFCVDFRTDEIEDFNFNF